MRVNKLDVGVEGIHRWRETDEVHLPSAGRLAPAFVPEQSALDEILRRPSLDERLVSLMQPQRLDQELLEAPILSQTRRRTREFFADMAEREPYAGNELRQAAELLAEDVELDETVSTALAALLRG